MSQLNETSVKYIAVEGVIGVGKTSLAKKLKEKLVVSEYNLWSDHRLLILLIFLLGLEWFFRKREGMI